MTTLTLVTAAAIARSRHFLPNEGETAIFGFASWAVAGVVVGGGLLVYSAKDSKQLRQTLGILWDVMAFFPRRFHPLAPPCYAERSVIDVRDRIIHATTGGKGSKRATGGMILVAHSEGTLISAAALLSLMQQPKSQNQIQAHPGHPVATGEELAHVRFVTYGCMLARLYSRAWPDQLPESSLMQLKAKLEDQPYDADHGYPCPKSETLPRWMNFGRYSDYLGGRVFPELQRKPTRLEQTSRGRSQKRRRVLH